MSDFTLNIYVQLLKSFIKNNYTIHSILESINRLSSKSIILRHDVDLQPENSLLIAQIEHDHGIKSTFYFRSISKNIDEKSIKKIASLSHEIGYHYENLVTCKGDFECAIKDFEKNLERFRKIVLVKTICMHGSPLNRWDSRLLWEKYDYHDYGIIGEPYFDIDFTKVLYLTDTGRRWDGEKFSVRDKVLRSDQVNRESGEAENKNLKIDENTVFLSDKYKFHSTFDIIRAAEKGQLPDKIMINMHPQRWTDKPLPWLKEYISQNAKNVVKRLFFVK